MKRVTLVTGNKNKYLSAKKKLEVFGIQLDQVEFEIIEPQKKDIQEVALYKAEQAFTKLQQSVIVNDIGWNITSLKGFPGPYMHFITDWFTVSDFLNLLREKEDRSICTHTVMVYKDSNITKVFETRRIGTILNHPKGIAGVALDKIITFRKDELTVSECKDLNINPFNEQDYMSVWDLFGKWYESSNL